MEKQKTFLDILWACPPSSLQRCGNAFLTMGCELSYFTICTIVCKMVGWEWIRPQLHRLWRFMARWYFLSSVVGGFVSDRILGSRKTVFYGGILIMLGAYCFGNTFWTNGSLSFYCLDYLWNWIFKTQYLRYGGGIYEKEDDRRDAGFSIFVFGINLGAFVALI